jgi:hypothetical protein
MWAPSIVIYEIDLRVFIVREPGGVRIEFAFDPRLENARKAHGTDPIDDRAGNAVLALRRHPMTVAVLPDVLTIYSVLRHDTRHGAPPRA